MSLAVYARLTDIVKEILEFDEIMVDITNHRGNRTALMLAAERNNREIVELLLRRGAGPNLKNFNGKIAIFRGVEEGGLEVVREVTAPQKGVHIFCPNGDSCTLLHGAAEQGNVGILQILHERGLQANSRDSIGMTLLHTACKCEKLEVYRYLLAIGAVSSNKDTYRRTPFIAAFQYGQTELMNLCRNEDTNKVGD